MWRDSKQHNFFLPLVSNSSLQPDHLIQFSLDCCILIPKAIYMVHQNTSLGHHDGKLFNYQLPAISWQSRAEMLRNGNFLGNSDTLDCTSAITSFDILEFSGRTSPLFLCCLQSVPRLEVRTSAPNPALALMRVEQKSSSFLNLGSSPQNTCTILQVSSCQQHSRIFLLAQKSFRVRIPVLSLSNAWTLCY